MEANQRCHVVMFPWLAFGHLIPFLELSRSLATRGFKVSFISTPRNIKRLPGVPLELSAQLSLVGFPLPPDDGLPEDAEATIDVELDTVQYLKRAYDGLRAPFEKFVEMTSPDWIIYDCVAYWVPQVASRFSIPCAYFCAFSAAAAAVFGPTWQLTGERSRSTPEEYAVVPEWINFPSTVKFSKYEAISICSTLGVPDVTAMLGWKRYATVIEGCDVVLIRSCTEYEGPYVGLLREIFGKPVKPVGLLPPAQDFWEPRATQMNPKWASCFSWLDAQAPNSVVFVGFGSECKLSVEQIHELAFGLEQSGLPFIWALRNPLGLPAQVDVLPEGYRTRLGQRGLVCMDWVPQVKILAHPSIGGHLFHSGWGSIIESLEHGIPLILVPMILDQGLNARLAEEKMVGIEIERNEMDGTFTRDDVAKALRLVMVEDEGEPLRAKAREMRSVFGNKGLQDEYIGGLVEYMNDQRSSKLIAERSGSRQRK
ncbi:UDP-glycosyltransferase 91C1 [Nymphaea colorata]|nr:UDP-glycosyltransferase 91C1 [Nymphaea colorata]